jgi:hypothetical protein
VLGLVPGLGLEGAGAHGKPMPRNEHRTVVLVL